MKKLMIAAAIVCAAAVSQAATCYWNFQTANGESLYDSGLETEYSGDVYAFMITASLTQDSVLQAALGGTSLADISGTKFKLTADEGVISKTSGNQTDGTGSANQKWFLAVVDGEKVYVSDYKSGGETPLTTGTTIKFAVEDSSSTFHDGAKTFSEGGWYAASVPEPFSGSLAVLGMGLLALRRKMKKAKKA